MNRPKPTVEELQAILDGRSPLMSTEELSAALYAESLIEASGKRAIVHRCSTDSSFRAETVTMTRLRSGLGAVLDAVAMGTPFVVERKGRALACLVPPHMVAVDEVRSVGGVPEKHVKHVGASSPPLKGSER